MSFRNYLGILKEFKLLNCNKSIMAIDLSFKIGGEAGQGLQTIGYILAKSLARGGLHIFANQDNESRIRGGHNFFQVRASDRPVQALSERIDIIIALDGRTITEHKYELVEDGIIIFDGEKIKPAEEVENQLSVPFERLAREKTGTVTMANSVAVGAALSLLDYDFHLLSSVLRDTLGEKGAEIADKNVRAARAGYDNVAQNSGGKFKRAVKTTTDFKDRILLTGNDAVASSALISGCKFMSGYPMSPSTPIQQFFASKMRDHDVIFEQGEDEISVINMALGASFAGVRSMVATSGGGFSLMVEGLSLAGMTETPIVIVICQRPGPATGFPTRTEQAELEFAIHAGHGEFPRAVFAPGNSDQAFYLTSKAFNLADKYQIPVIILSDQHLADSYFTTQRFDTSLIKVERGEFFTKSDAKRLEYKRHLITDTGISPRLLPGQDWGLAVTDSDEHTEDGHITELAEARTKNVMKRLKKFELLRKEIAPPYVHGPEDAETLLIGWGSTYGALKEAIEILNSQGSKVRMLHLSEVWPFPAEAVSKELKKTRSLVSVESNATGQMAHLIRAETGIEVNSKVLRFDGRPISPAYIIRELSSRV
jgi:2-oxoglutarate ferredoxin oxidoreductase subunit alpha